MCKGGNTPFTNKMIKQIIPKKMISCIFCVLRKNICNYKCIGNNNNDDGDILKHFHTFFLIIDGTNPLFTFPTILHPLLLVMQLFLYCPFSLPTKVQLNHF